MARKPPRDDEQSIDPDIVAGAHVARRQPLGGNCHPAEAVAVERKCRGLGGGARLDLDEGERAPSAGDYVDLASGHPGTAGEDPPAVKAEPPGGDCLGAAAAFLGPAAVHLLERISARA